MYFSNSKTPDIVKHINVEGNKIIINLEGFGSISNSRFIYHGVHISLNQRVKLHDLLEVEGIITDFGISK